MRLLVQVCYSWWCLSALSILGRLHWISQDALTRYILFCQVWLAGSLHLPPQHCSWGQQDMQI